MSDRPCNCDNCVVGGPYENGHCRLCWLFHNDKRYREKWLEKKMPSLINQAANLVNATVKRAIGGFKDVEEEMYQKRLSICETCPNKTDDWRCTKCGCFLNIKAKWESETCPENKWPLLVIEKKGGCGCANKK